MTDTKNENTIFKPMEKESIKRFISQFDAVLEASILLKGTTDNKRIEYFTKDIELCYKIQENPKLLDDTIIEIENNLYSFPILEQRIAYIKDLLRSFVNIAPYFDQTTETDTNINHEVGVFVVPGAKYTMQIINSYCCGDIKNLETLPIEKLYIICCFKSLHHFTPLLDAKCLSFGIDLQEIQNEVEIYIQHRRQWDILSHYGYKQNEFNKRELQTGKPTVIESDNKVDRTEQKYTIKDTDHSKIKAVYDHSNGKIFECTYATFIQSIEAVNFEIIDIKTTTKVQDLTFRLSGIMDEVWYTEICQKMNWSKGICSGQGKKYKENLWTKKLDKIIPRPQKE